MYKRQLLRIGRQRLTGTHAEQRRIEKACTVEETASSGVGLARLVGVRVVEAVDVPATVGREVGDRVHAVGDQVPQLLRRLHPTGEAASHRDDGDRLVRGDGGGDSHLRGVVADEFCHEMRGEHAGRREVEDERRRQPKARPGVQGIAQLDGGQRVEPEVLERPVLADCGNVVVAEHRGDLLADQVDQLRLVELAHDSGRGDSKSARLAHKAVQQRRHIRHRREVQANRCHHRDSRAERCVERGQPLVRGERQDTGPRYAMGVRVSEGAGHAGVRRPRTPGQRHCR